MIQFDAQQASARRVLHALTPRHRADADGPLPSGIFSAPLTSRRAHLPSAALHPWHNANFISKFHQRARPNHSREIQGYLCCMIKEYPNPIRGRLGPVKEYPNSFKGCLRPIKRCLNGGYASLDGTWSQQRRSRDAPKRNAPYGSKSLQTFLAHSPGRSTMRSSAKESLDTAAAAGPLGKAGLLKTPGSERRTTAAVGPTGEAGKVRSTRTGPRHTTAAVGPAGEASTVQDKAGEGYSGEGCSGEGYSVDDALTALRFGPFQWLLLAYTGLAWAAEAMEVLLLSFMGPAAGGEWGLVPGQEALLSSVVFGGMLVGAYGWGILADTKGRKFGFTVTALFTVFAGLASAAAPSFAFLLITRALVGVGLGGAPVVFSLFMEFVPPAQRGFWLIAVSTFWTVGSFLEAALAWAVLPSLGWRWLVAISAAPFAVLLLFFPLLPESPRFLLAKCRRDEAQAVLERIARVNNERLPAGQLRGPKVLGRAALEEDVESPISYKNESLDGALEKRRTSDQSSLIWGGFGPKGLSPGGKEGSRKPAVDSRGWRLRRLVAAMGRKQEEPVLMEEEYGRGLREPLVRRGGYQRDKEPAFGIGTRETMPSESLRGRKGPSDKEGYDRREESAIESRARAVMPSGKGGGPKGPLGMGKSGMQQGSDEGSWFGSAMRRETADAGKRDLEGDRDGDARAGSVASWQTGADGGMLMQARAELAATGQRGTGSFPSAAQTLLLLFSPGLRNTTALLWAVFFASAFCYYGFVLLTTELSSPMGPECIRGVMGAAALHADDGTQSYKDILLTSAGELPGLLAAAALVDRIGRKNTMALLMSGAASCSLLLLVLLGEGPLSWTLGTPLDLWLNSIGMSRGSIVVGALFIARACVMGAFQTLFIYAPEVYPTPVRTTGLGAANAFSRLGGVICPFVAVGLLRSCHQDLAFILFATVPLMASLAALKFPIETSQRQLSEDLNASD